MRGGQVKRPVKYFFSPDNVLPLHIVRHHWVVLHGLWFLLRLALGGTYKYTEHPFLFLFISHKWSFSDFGLVRHFCKRMQCIFCLSFMAIFIVKSHYFWPFVTICCTVIFTNIHVALHQYYYLSRQKIGWSNIYYISFFHDTLAFINIFDYTALCLTTFDH